MFLGMGNQELNLLGYEDMEEFRNYHNDVADLFVNKPGFIFKFKNFSWIDYTLHSGTPNRRVLIKTKNGREIETSLLIHEIFLEKEMHDAKVCFGVELLTGLQRNEPLASPAAVEPSMFSSSPILEPESSSFILEDAPSFITEKTEPIEEKLVFEEESIAFSEPTLSIEDDFILPQEEKSLNNESLDEPSPIPFKLKFDTTILDVPVKIEINEAPFSETLSEPTASKNSVTSFDSENYLEDQHEDLRNDPMLFVEKTPVAPVANEPLKAFDFAQSAESLGVDFSTLAEVIEEYIIELDTKTGTIEQLIVQGETKTAAEEISKLSSIASHLGIDSLLWHFNALEQSLETSSAEDIEVLFTQTQKAITEFKDLVQ